MSSHIDRTAFNTRQEITSQAVVKKIFPLSETVKFLMLEIKNDNFTFKSGQWVDMFIPCVPVVGGFSMCSPPHLLKASRVLNLAVKYSAHPPAHWVHTQCKVGDTVSVRVGGDMVYDPDASNKCRNLILIAGGVGINPLFSMMQHFLYINAHSACSQNKGTTSTNHVVLLCSAQDYNELIFKNELKEISTKNKNVIIKLFSTRELVTNDNLISNGRIKYSDVQSILTKQEIAASDVFICGPLPFIETMEKYCIDAGFDKDCIKAERWW